MITILTSIFDFLVNIFNFIVHIVQEIIYVIKTTTAVLSSLGSFFVFLPATVSAILISLITLAIAYKIAGRD